MKSLFYLCLLLSLVGLSPSSYASVTILEVGNASNWTLGSSATPTIYGGISGLDTAGDCATKTGLNTCNSCSADLKACNQQRIYDSLVLEIVFRASNGAAGKVIATNEDRTRALTNQSGSFADSDPNQGSVIRLLWRDVCSVVGETPSGCNMSFTNRMFVGIDSNGNGILDSDEESIPVLVRVVEADPSRSVIDHCEQNPQPTQGICSFSAYPGNAKAYIDDLGNAVGFPNGAGVKFTHLRFYYSKTSFAAVTPNLGTFKDIEIESDDLGFGLTDNRIEGLENGLPHFFRVATIDEARNISNLTSDSAIKTYCGATPEANENCPFRVVPSQMGHP